MLPNTDTDIEDGEVKRPGEDIKPKSDNFLTADICQQILSKLVEFTDHQWVEIATKRGGKLDVPEWLVSLAQPQLARIIAAAEKLIPSYMSITEEDTYQRFHYLGTQAKKNPAKLQELESKIQRLVNASNTEEEKRISDEISNYELELICSDEATYNIIKNHFTRAIRNGRFLIATRLVKAGVLFGQIRINPLFAQLKDENQDLWFAIFLRVEDTFYKNRIGFWLSEEVNETTVVNEVARQGKEIHMGQIIRHFPGRPFIPNRGETPLESAAKNRHYNVCRLILTRAPNAISELKFTAMEDQRLNEIYVEAISAQTKREKEELDEREHQSKVVFETIKKCIQDDDMSTLGRLVNNNRTLTAAQKKEIQPQLQRKMDEILTLEQLLESVNNYAAQIGCRVREFQGGTFNACVSLREFVGITLIPASIGLFILGAIFASATYDSTSPDVTVNDIAKQNRAGFGMIAGAIPTLVLGLLLVLRCKKLPIYPTFKTLPSEVRGKIATALSNIEFKNDTPTLEVSSTLQTEVARQVHRKAVLDTALRCCDVEQKRSDRDVAISVNVEINDEKTPLLSANSSNNALISHVMKHGVADGKENYADNSNLDTGVPSLDEEGVPPSNYNRLDGP